MGGGGVVIPKALHNYVYVGSLVIPNVGYKGFQFQMTYFWWLDKIISGL